MKGNRPAATSALGKRVRDRRRELKMTQAALAAASGIKQSTISYIESGRNTETRYIVELAAALRVRARWLKTGLGPKEASGTPDGDGTPRLLFIDRYKDIRLGAGAGIEQLADGVIDQIAFREDWLRGKGWRAASLRAVSACGRSMEPRIQNGDLLLVDVNDKRVTSGRVYAIRDSTGDRVKRLFLSHDGAVRIRSDNESPEFPEEVVPADKLDQIEIIGRVVWLGGLV